MLVCKSLIKVEPLTLNVEFRVAAPTTPSVPFKLVAAPTVNAPLSTILANVVVDELEYEATFPLPSQ